MHRPPLHMMYTRMNMRYSRLFPTTFTRPRASVILLALCISAIAVLVLAGRYFAWGARFTYRTFEFVSVTDVACDGVDDTPSRPGSPPIPNLVHYVWLLANPAEFRLGFKIFVSVYSAHIFWRPERIYIHTDAGADVISRARQSGSPWTRRILALPQLEINFVDAPQRTNKGVGINTMAHKADFVRLAALREYGGVYLDTDAIPLRDVADLRNSGFRNVIGQQLGLGLWVINHLNELNNGVMMAVPRSNLINLFYHTAHEFFDGQWETASIQLLTDLGNRLAALPAEVLILQPQAFSPMSWQDEDQARLFAPSLDPVTAPTPESEEREGVLRATAAESGLCGDVLAWLKYREEARGGALGQGTGVRPVGAASEIDFSSSYVLHAFDGALDKVLGKGNGIDVRYVLSRQSNYARAVFPAVWQAVEEGIIPKEDIT